MTERAENAEEYDVVEAEEEFDDVGIYLTAEENFTLLLCDARIKNAELSRRLREAEYEKQETKFALQLLQQKTRLQNEVAQLRAEKERIRMEMEAIKSAVEERLGVNMNECTYDPDTGRLTKPPE